MAIQTGSCSPDHIVFLTVKNEELQKLIIERSPEWVKATGEKLNVLIHQIVTLTSHTNWKVRLAMVNWTEQLLMECTQ
jgi:hypothetical protein